MTPILTTSQTRELDAYTIANEPISSIDLMERASREFVSWVVQRVDVHKKVGVVCGTGNNGGDGLAIARLLSDWAYDVKVWIVKGPASSTDDFKKNLQRAAGRFDIAEITTEADQGLFTDRDVLIDAIFGSGLSRPPEGIYAQAIRCINKSEATVISVDVPSGLNADGPSSGEIVQADFTVTFQLPKLSFFLPQSFQYTGEFSVVDIGLSKTKIRSSETNYFLVDKKHVKHEIKPRKKFSHKGDFGHALLIAGSYGKMGAAVLSSRAVLRSGVGLLTVHVPKCGYEIIQTSVPEAMALVDSGEQHFTEASDLEKFSTIGVGPGLGQETQTAQGLKKIFQQYKNPMVLDADALNILAADSEMQKLIPAGSILTPHPKEFERLAGKWSNDFERLEKQKELSKRLQCVIVLKGAFTSIAEPEGRVYFNPTGNPGMASGGTGDVLTGILTGLMAQFYSPIQAAVVGTYLHGLAGDIAVNDKGKPSLIASDLVEFLPQAFRKISD